MRWMSRFGLIKFKLLNQATINKNKIKHNLKTNNLIKSTRLSNKHPKKPYKTKIPSKHQKPPKTKHWLKFL